MALNLDVGVATRNFRHFINEDNYFLPRESNNGFVAEYLRFVDFLNREAPKEEKERVEQVKEDRFFFKDKEHPVMIYRESVPFEKTDFGTENRLFVVCDGVTNSYCSPICTTEAIERLFSRFYNGNTAPVDLDEMLQNIDKEILELGKWYGKTVEIGEKLFRSTAVMTLALIQQGRLLVKHVGDTKLFLLRDGLEKITEDQPLGVRPDTYIGHGEIKPVTYEKDLQSGDLVLICTDGITDPYKDIFSDSGFDFNPMLNLLDTRKSAQEICDGLVECSADSYKRKMSVGDDATAIVIKYQ